MRDCVFCGTAYDTPESESNDTMTGSPLQFVGDAGKLSANPHGVEGGVSASIALSKQSETSGIVTTDASF